LSTGPIALLPVKLKLITIDFNTLDITIFYLFKLNEEYSTLVWSIKKHLAKELLEISDEQFVHRVNEAFVTHIYIY